MKTARNLSNTENREIIMYGRRLLFAKIIGPECSLCGKVTSDVVMIRNVGLATNMEFLPICETCKLKEADRVLIEEESA